MPRLALACVAAFALFSIPVTAGAQSDADVALAKQQFLLGKTYYDQGAYQRALSLFQESYRTSKKADLLYNIGRCYESLAMLNEAISTYREYLKKTGRQDSNVNARIRNLQVRLQLSQPKVPDKAPDKVPDKAPDKAPEKGQAPAVTAPTAGDSTPGASRGGIHWMKWAGWGLLGVGGVSIAASIAFGAKAASKSQAVDDLYARNAHDWSEAKPFYDDGKSFQTLQIVTMVLGILSVGGGTALWLLAPNAASGEHPDGATATPSASAHLAPLVTENTLGIFGSFTF